MSFLTRSGIHIIITSFKGMIIYIPAYVGMTKSSKVIPGSGQESIKFLPQQRRTSVRLYKTKYFLKKSLLISIYFYLSLFYIRIISDIRIFIRLIRIF